MNKQDQIYAMLESLCLSFESRGEPKQLLQMCSGYSYGRTSNDDPFILLYSAREAMTEKICRVYPAQFKYLPRFIATDNIPANAPDTNPSRNQAIKANRFFYTPMFYVLLNLGWEVTSMGRELRFHRVLYETSYYPDFATPPPAPADKPKPKPKPQAQPKPAPQPAEAPQAPAEEPQALFPEEVDEESRVYHLDLARRAKSAKDFDTHIYAAYADKIASPGKAEAVRQVITEVWTPNTTGHLADSIKVYWKTRDRWEEEGLETIEAHRRAKSDAAGYFHRQLNGRPGQGT